MYMYMYFKCCRLPFTSNVIAKSTPHIRSKAKALRMRDGRRAFQPTR